LVSESGYLQMTHGFALYRRGRGRGGIIQRTVGGMFGATAFRIPLASRLSDVFEVGESGKNLEPRMDSRVEEGRGIACATRFPSPLIDVLCPLPRWTALGASVGCFPRSCCLPRTPGGSASTTSLSRPAQALHTLRPVDSLRRRKRRLSQGFDTASYPTAPPASYRANRPLPGWDLHPQGDHAIRGAPDEHG
jgi:hypothetical protein